MGDWESYIVPAVVLCIVISAIRTRTPAFDAFKDGAAEGLQTMLQLLPTLIGLFTAIHMLRASGAFELLTDLLQPLTAKLGFPAEILPLMLLRPISGSGATAYVAELLGQYGADSDIGRMASVLSASTDTTFYAVAVYLGRVGIKKSGWIIPAALLGDLTASVLAVLTVHLLY